MALDAVEAVDDFLEQVVHGSIAATLQGDKQNRTQFRVVLPPQL